MKSENISRKSDLELHRKDFIYVKAGIKFREELNIKFKGFFEKSFFAMVKEFDKYIDREHYPNEPEKSDLPWWYNERATLGFYISGLLRDSKNIVLQEFACEKRKQKGHDNLSLKQLKGRADLYINHCEERYLLEAKFCFTEIKDKSDKDREWGLGALEQARNYKVVGIPGGNKFSLCFESVYHNGEKSNRENLLKNYNWLNASEIMSYWNYDFYGVVALSDEALSQGIGRLEEDGNWYPALAVSGCKNK